MPPLMEPFWRSRTARPETGEGTDVQNARNFDGQTSRSSRKKSPAGRTCSCGLKKAHHGAKRRRLVTVVGEVQLVRVYFRCTACGESGYAADTRFGVDGRFSSGVQRLACLAAASWSFDISSQRLEEFCGVCIADNSIRSIAQGHGAKMAAWQNSDPEACCEFREADGEVEFATDGTSVNTTSGWREMKIGIFVAHRVDQLWNCQNA